MFDFAIYSCLKVKHKGSRNAVLKTIPYPLSCLDRNARCRRSRSVSERDTKRDVSPDGNLSAISVADSRFPSGNKGGRESLFPIPYSSSVPFHWLMRKTINSAGRTGQIPTSIYRRPRIIVSGGFNSASHLT